VPNHFARFLPTRRLSCDRLRTLHALERGICKLLWKTTLEFRGPALTHTHSVGGNVFNDGHLFHDVDG
jgi:hypothetical protein